MMRYSRIRRSRPLLALIVVGLALSSAGCGGGDSETVKQAAPTAAPIAVSTAVATIDTLTDRFWATGSVEALRRVQPGTKILGRIDRVLVREGDRVERGQILARIESRDLEAAVTQAEAAVAMAAAELDNARVHHQRMQALHGRGSVTDKSLEDATAGFKVRQAAVAQAEANLAAARVSLGYAEIRSPFAGWVVAKHVEAGDMAAPGSPFFTLEDLSQAKVEVQVPETEITGLERGAPATVEILGTDYPAEVDRVVPAGDPQSRTFAVQLVLDNADGKLKSGMFARVSFARGERRALRVPGSAVVERGQLSGLFTVDGDRARLRWIKAGPRQAGQVEILSGLEEGERYVVAPPAELADGSPIEVTS